MFILYLLLDFQHLSKLYTLTYNFILHFDKYLLLELIYYVIYYMHFFSFKILIIKYVKLVLVNIVMDRQVLY